MAHINPGSSPSTPDPFGDNNRLHSTTSIRGEDLCLDGIQSTGLAFAKITSDCLLRVGENPLQMVPEKTYCILEELELFSIRIAEDSGAVRPALSALGKILFSGVQAIDVEERVFFIACAISLISKTSEPEDAASRLVTYVLTANAQFSSSRELRKLLFAIREIPSFLSPDSVRAFFDTRAMLVATDDHLDKALLSAPSERTNTSVKWFRGGQGGRHNDPPVAPEYTERRERIFRESLEVFRRSVMHSGAFWRLSGETSSLPGQHERSPSLLAAFGKECFQYCSDLFNSDPNSSPGRGFLLSRPRRERLFFSGTSTSGIGFDQEKIYSEALGNLGTAYEEFPKAVFAFLRGMIIVYHPSDRYRLTCSGVSTNPAYVLVIHNDHLHGGYEYARLVPLNRISPAVLGACFDPNEGPRENTNDLAHAGLNDTELSRKLTTAPYGIDLSNISTIYGGLVSGLPQGSYPLFSWELDQTPDVVWKDNRGRYHYGWLQRQNGNLRYQLGYSGDEHSRQIIRDALLKPYEDASHEVFNVASGLFDLVDLFYHRYSAWKNDLTPSPRSLPLMLTRVYEINQSLQYGLSVDDVPQLCVVDRFDFSMPPVAVVDPLSLTIRIGNGRFRLPRTLDGWDTQEFNLWRSAVKSWTTSQNRETVNELAFVRKPYIPEDTRI